MKAFRPLLEVISRKSADACARLRDYCLRVHRAHRAASAFLAERAAGQAILMDTAIGNPVRNVQASSISHPVASRALEDLVAFPSQLRARAHPRFNCHGLVFSARRNAIIEDSEVNKILREDGYQSVDRTNVLPGDIAIYFTQSGTIDHSGIVVTKPAGPNEFPFVCSKWGAIGPEVYHLATDCLDYAISDIRYYRIMP